MHSEEETLKNDSSTQTNLTHKANTNHLSVSGNFHTSPRLRTLNDTNVKRTVEGEGKYRTSELLVLWELVNPTPTTYRSQVLPKDKYTETSAAFLNFAEEYFLKARKKSVMLFFEKLHKTNSNLKLVPENPGFSPFSLLNVLDSNEGFIGRCLATLFNPNPPPPFTPPTSMPSHTQTLPTSNLNSHNRQGKNEHVLKLNENELVKVQTLMRTLTNSHILFYNYPLGFAKNVNTPRTKLVELLQHDTQEVQLSALITLNIVERT